MRSFPAPLVLLALLALSVGCGSTPTSNPGPAAGSTPAVEPLPPEIAATRSVAAALAGTWQGRITFQQDVGGAHGSHTVSSWLVFDAAGWPQQLPGLGLVSGWQSYASTSIDDGIAAALSGVSNDLYVYCDMEADGSANALHLVPRTAAATPAQFTWSYEARYHFADLFTYSLYDYLEPGAPVATVTATESYELAGDTLDVEAHADGMTDSGKAVSLRFHGTLQRADAGVAPACAIR